MLLAVIITACNSDERSKSVSRTGSDHELVASLLVNDTLYEHTYVHPLTLEETTLKFHWPLISSAVFKKGLDSLVYTHLNYTQVMGETVDETFTLLEEYGEGLNNIGFHVHKNGDGIFSVTYTICNKTVQSYCFEHIVNLDLHDVSSIELKSLIDPGQWSGFLALCSGGFNMELGYMQERIAEDYPDIHDFYEGYEYDIETLNTFELTDSSLVLKYDFNFPSFAALFEPDGILEFEWDTIRSYLNMKNPVVQRLLKKNL